MGSRPSTGQPAKADRWFLTKSQAHLRLLSEMTPDQLRSQNQEQVRERIGPIIERLIAEEGVPMTSEERERLTAEVLDEALGLGPLETLLKDTTVSDILVNGFDNVYVERGGRLVETNIRFKDEAHLRLIIDRVVANLGGRIDESSPIVDARLPDGSRVCAVIPPLSMRGPVMSIRRFGRKLRSTEELLRDETLTNGMLDFLGACVEARVNIVVSGGSGAGKTTFLNTLSRFIPESERLITVEEAAELQIQQPHVVRLEPRPLTIDGAGMVTQRDLVINALRMRPDRILVGECRGPEALDILQAMNTGYDGSMTTVHANSARDVFTRLETMVLMAGEPMPDLAIRQISASAIQIVVHCARLNDGTRKIVEISEVTGVDRESVETQPVFEMKRTGISARGKVLGKFRATGHKPLALERLRACGIRLSETLFREEVEVKDK